MTNATKEGDVAALERDADAARAALASDIVELGTRGEEAASVARGVPRAVLRLGTGALVALSASVVVAKLTGRGVFRTIGDITSGLTGGLVAGWAMTRAHTAWSKVERRVLPPPRSEMQTQEGSPRAEQADQGGGGSGGEEAATIRMAKLLLSEPIPAEHRAAAGTVVHYLTSCAFGATYGLAAGLVPQVTLGRGLGYGAAVWLMGDELVVPVLGLARGPRAYPLRTHLRALFAHLVYGATLDAARRLLGRRAKR
jgi:putative membrane protein